jgi:hypothetical protein
VEYTVNQRDGMTALDHYIIADLVVTRKRGKRLSAWQALHFVDHVASKVTDREVNLAPLHAPTLRASNLGAQLVDLFVWLIESQ